MPTLEFIADFDAPLETVWAFYDDIAVLPKITPPTTKVRVLDPSARMTEGSRFTLIVRQPPIYIPLRWETIIVQHQPPHLFVDEQGKGPFAYWRHEHRFEARAGGGTRLRDIVTYRPPFGILGRIADKLFLRRLLVDMFAYRHQKTREMLESRVQV